MSNTPYSDSVREAMRVLWEDDYHIDYITGIWRYISALRKIEQRKATIRDRDLLKALVTATDAAFYGKPYPANVEGSTRAHEVARAVYHMVNPTLKDAKK